MVWEEPRIGSGLRVGGVIVWEEPLYGRSFSVGRAFTCSLTSNLIFFFFGGPYNRRYFDNSDSDKGTLKASDPQRI